MTRVLSVASECAPLVKTGGLADVAGALPAALAGQGVEMRTLLPGYPAVMAALEDATPLAAIETLFGGPARLLGARAAGLDLLVIDAPHLFDRAGGPYLDPVGQDWPDNADRFAALSRVAADIAAGRLGDWQPDLVHCHDWQAGLVPYYLRREKTGVPSVLTIHNIAFQGLTPMDRAADLGIAAATSTRTASNTGGSFRCSRPGWSSPTG